MATTTLLDITRVTYCIWPPLPQIYSLGQTLPNQSRVVLSGHVLYYRPRVGVSAHAFCCQVTAIVVLVETLSSDSVTWTSPPTRCEVEAGLWVGR